MSGKTDSLRWRGMILFLSLAVVGGGCSGKDASPDGAGDQDGDRDGHEDLDGDGDVIRCDELEARFDAYVQEHLACQISEECAVVGGTGTCDCAPALGRPSGTAIRTDAVDGTRPFFERFEECKDQGWPGGACDAGPAVNLRCQAGRCLVEDGYCRDGG
jgi:hypothetical protein